MLQEHKKIFNKMLANRIQQYIKEQETLIKWDYKEYKAALTYENSLMNSVIVIH